LWIFHLPSAEFSKQSRQYLFVIRSLQSVRKGNFFNVGGKYYHKMKGHVHSCGVTLEKIFPKKGVGICRSWDLTSLKPKEKGNQKTEQLEGTISI
jgi:hypothetical protein